MPYMPVQQRAQGLSAPRAIDPHDGGPCTCDWTDPATWTAANLAHRVLRPPDQSRYGSATTDPLGRTITIGEGGQPYTDGLPRYACDQCETPRARGHKGDHSVVLRKAG